jgi:hypothetical protein
MNRHLIIIATLVLGFSIFLKAQTAMPAGTTISSVPLCSGTFTDQNAGGNYSPNQNSTLTICPSTPGQFVSITFTSFNTENGIDFLRIFNGSTGTSGILAALSGTTLPGTYTSSSPGGCLTFRFFSDGGNNRAGWSATISCSPTAGPTPINSITQFVMMLDLQAIAVVLQMMISHWAVMMVV